MVLAAESAEQARRHPSYSPQEKKDASDLAAARTAASGRSHVPWLAAILAVFLIVAVIYNLNTPIYESPDELQHTAYAVWLVDEGTLPVLDPEAPGSWEQEATQPPLYYGIVAALVGWVPHEDSVSLAKLNRYANVGIPLQPGNKNRVLHDAERESWPYQESVLLVHLARAVSTLMALGSLGAIYRLGRIAFPDRPGIALGMVGLAAFIPQFLFISASVNNDNLVILTSAWTLVLLAGWLRSPGLPGWPSLAGLGILLVLGALAKISGVLLWPLSAATLFWLAWRSKNLRWLVPAGLLVFGVALALTGWWFARNLRLYGDLSGFTAHLAVTGGQRQQPSDLRAIYAEFRGFRYSFWALFGWFNVLVPEPFYWITDAASTLGLAGFLLALTKRLRRGPRWKLEIIVLVCAWFCLVVIGLFQWTTLTYGSQGRLLFPALSAVALVLVTGWAALVPRRLWRPLGSVALIGWIAWSVACALFFLRPAYALPPRADSLAGLGLAPARLNVRYGDCCELVGYVQPEQPVHSGDWVPLVLIWKALSPTQQNYTLYVHASTVSGETLDVEDTHHGSGMFPTGQWRVGEFIADTVYVHISWEVEEPTAVRFFVGLYDVDPEDRLPAFSADGERLEAVVAGEVAAIPLQWPGVQPDPSVDTLFSRKIRLTNAEIEPGEAQPGDTVTVTLHWQALGRITEDYTGFVHLVNTEGIDIAQDDHLPLQGGFPTRLWHAGMVVTDTYRLELPRDIVSGHYELRGGLYRPESGQRLSALSLETGARWQDDLVLLGILTVGELDQ